MKYLLDTHAIIWYFEDSAELSQTAAELIDDPENSIYICSVSLWEIAIKISLGKLKMSMPFDELLALIKTRDFNIMQIEYEYLSNLSELPYIHKDPFDRMIVSSALAARMPVITADTNIRKYNAPCIW